MILRGGIYLLLFICFSCRIAAIPTVGKNDPFPLRRRLQEDPSSLVEASEIKSPENESGATSKPLMNESDPLDVTQLVAADDPSRKEENTATPQEEVAEQQPDEETQPTGNKTENEIDITTEKPETGSEKQSVCNGTEGCEACVGASLSCVWNGNLCVEVEEPRLPSSTAEICTQNENQGEVDEKQQDNKEIPESKKPTIQQTNDTNNDNISGTGEINMATGSGSTSSGNEQYDDGESSSFAIFTFLFATALIGGGVVWFRRLKRNENGNAISSSISEFGVPKAGGKNFNHSETVPLASTDDDEEWGWEDNSQRQGGDVELTGTKKEDDDLTRAFAMQSPGLPRNISAQAPKVNKRSSPIVSRTKKKIPPIPNFPSTTNTKTTPSVPSLKITSLGKSSGIPKKPMKKKTTDDDLFASMGLAAKPTFSQSKPKVESKSSVATSKLSTLASADLGSADWDEDGDLDDLLND